MIKFTTKDDGTFRCVLEGERHVARYWARSPKADVHAAHLNKEHARGRVAQSTCGPEYAPRVNPLDPDEVRVLVHPAAACDYERVNLPEMLTDAERKSLVMCDRHKGAFGT